MTRTPAAPDAPLLRRVRWRLTLLSSGATLATLVVLGVAIFASVSTSLAASGEAQLRRQADAGVGFVHRFGPGPSHGQSRDGDFPLGRPVFGGPGSGTLTVLIQPDGSVWEPDSAELEGLPLTASLTAAKVATGDDIRTADVNGTPVRVLTQPIQVGDETWYVQILQDRTAEERTLAILLLVLVGGGMAVLAASVLIGFAYAGRALVPIRESLRRQREFAADASHELRTPLSVIRGSVEHLRRNARMPVQEVGAALDDIDAEVAQLSGLVDDLLLLARADSGAIELRAQALDLSETAGMAMHALRDVAGRRGVELRLEARPAVVNGDPDRLRQLVGILVDNAIKHSPSGSTVDVRVEHVRDRVQLRVEDQGGGIDPADLDRVFDRFWRAKDAPAGGTGLGLAIARWIAERHAGTIAALNSPNGGARFEVHLPAA
ncbi:MAG: sensor histidine kinase [Candidatus Limnocylindria bacterium]